MKQAGIQDHIEDLRQWIGREIETMDIVTPDLVAKFCATLDFPTVAEGAAVPPLLHFCLAQPVEPTNGLSEDGHPRKGSFLPPVPLERRMWASGEIAFHHDLFVGQSVRRRSRIADVTAKDGRSGQLCFVKVEHNLDANGVLAITETQSIVYRGGDQPGAAPASNDPLRQASRTEHVNPTAPLLFRYSALTFNGHRIHYDRRYAQDVEKYPGLVVHGPLQATLLCNFAKRIMDRGTPRLFRFRSQAPLFDGVAFSLNADGRQEDGLQLWTESADHRVATLAEAHWNNERN